MATKKITLEGDATKLIEVFQKYPTPTQKQILAHCKLTDGTTTFENDQIKDPNCFFKLELNGNIHWDGEATGSTQGFIPGPIGNMRYSIAIDSISYDYNPPEPAQNIFDGILLKGTGGRHSKVIQQARHMDNEKEPNYWYRINFTIYERNTPVASFFIDPKLRIYK